MMSKVSSDRQIRVEIIEWVDGKRQLQAAVIVRAGHAPELLIPQRGHSSVGENGDFSTFLSEEVLRQIGQATPAAPATAPMPAPAQGPGVTPDFRWYCFRHCFCQKKPGFCCQCGAAPYEGGAEGRSPVE